MKLIVLLLALLPLGVQAQADIMDNPKEVECLAKNIYFEARNQSHTGKIAVAQVVLNRMIDERFPESICGVIYQARLTSSGQPIRHKCHFSWFCDGLSDRPRDRAAWLDAIDVARDSILIWEGGFDITDGSTHYHTTKVNPRWNRELTYINTIDDHMFWRWEG